MKRLHWHFLMLCFAVITTTGYSQENPQDQLRYNRAALRFFSGVELNAMETDHPDHYEALLYYFTRSFKVTPADCEGCEMDHTSLYNYDLFNVAEHESKRLDATEFTFTYREKYRITLLSKQTITGVMGMSVEQVMHKDFRPLPYYVDNGNMDADYANYKQALRAWIVDFPEEYRVLTSQRNIPKIRVADFLQLSNSRKTALHSQPNTYLLID